MSKVVTQLDPLSKKVDLLNSHRSQQQEAYKSVIETELDALVSDQAANLKAAAVLGTQRDEAFGSSTSAIEMRLDKTGKTIQEKLKMMAKLDQDYEIMQTQRSQLMGQFDTVSLTSDMNPNTGTDYGSLLIGGGSSC